MSDMDLSLLAEPFPVGDIEWRVRTAGKAHSGKTFCKVLAYITARAIQNRLDEVCGPESWGLKEPRVFEVSGKSAFGCGISIRLNDEWVTKWDVSGATNIEPAKGGYSGAMKRAGAQWGIGRYLYHLTEKFADVFDGEATSGKELQKLGWRYATLSKEHGGGMYYWKPPRLPEWALPKEPDCEVSKEELTGLVMAWREKFAAGVKSSAERLEGFARFVHSIAGEFPVGDRSCWTQAALVKVQKRIDSTTDPEGPDSSVPFEGAKE